MNTQDSTNTKRSFVSISLGAVKLLRPRQWVKNGFVFAPLIFAGEFLNQSHLTLTILTAILFCVASSFVYIINDIQDIERDRNHPIKSKTRPLAAGLITTPHALTLLAVLAVLLVWGWFQFPNPVTVIACYIILNLAYTFFLKHQPVIDIFTIAIGFVLRVYAGAQALSVPVSSWMFVSTLSLALFLASIKRQQEILHSKGSGETRAVLNEYSAPLVNRYAEISAACSLVFYSLFVLESRPELIMTIPFVLYGIFRYWFVVDRYGAGESPTDVLLKDWQLLFTVFAWVCVCVWNIWPTGS